MKVPVLCLLRVEKNVPKLIEEPLDAQKFDIRDSSGNVGLIVGLVFLGVVVVGVGIVILVCLLRRRNYNKI